MNHTNQQHRKVPNLSFRSTLKPALLLLLFSALFIAGWAALAPQHSAVIASAEVTLKGKKHTIQYQERAYIAAVFVEEGDEVQKGQTLLRLDDRELKTLARSLEEQWLESQLQLLFLDATINDTEHLNIPPPLLHLAESLEYLPRLRQRKEVYSFQREHLKRELALLDIQYQRHQSHAQSHENERQRVLQQLSLMQPELRAIETLSATDMIAKNSLLKLRGAALELTKNAETLAAKTQQSKLLKNQARLEQTQRRQQRILVAQTERQQLNRSLPKLIKDRQLIQYKRMRFIIKAPVNGRVQHLQVNAIGSHLEADQPIMEIIPSSAPLLVEAKIAPQDIEKVLYSKQAKIRLSAYDSRRIPLLEAKILGLSAHILQDTKGHKFYRLQLRIPAEQLARVPYVKLYPGMPAEAIVVSKSRTIWQYLFNQISKTSQRSLREA